MLKKSLMVILMVLLLASCTMANDADKEPEVATPELVEEPEEIKYTGEIITDGFFEEQGRIYFIPDKETRELLKNEYPYTIGAGESIPLDYDDINIVKDLPKELGITRLK